MLGGFVGDNELKVCSVRGNQTCSVGACCKSDEYIEMKIPELLGSEAVINSCLA